MIDAINKHNPSKESLTDCEVINKQDGYNLNSFFADIGALSAFAFRFFKEALRPPYEFNEFLKQSYLIGYKSLGLVGITGFIMGLVLTIQSRPTLAVFGAELASMKVTEQIDAMEVSGINPFNYIVVTRVLACTFMIPLLTVFADAIGLLGGFAGVNIKGDTSFSLYFLQVFNSLDFMDLFPSLIKSFFFGQAVGIVGCYKGYNCNEGTEGVGKAANSAVVMASLAIFVIDMIAVQITSFFM